METILQDELIVSNLQEILQNSLTVWHKIILTYASRFFIMIAGINLIYRMIKGILDNSGTVDPSKLISDFIKFTLITGIFYFILFNGTQYASYIVNSFIQIGMESFGYANSEKSAIDKVLNVGYLIVDSIDKSTSKGIIATIKTLPAYLLAGIIYILLFIIVGNYIVEVAAAWIMIYAGYIVLLFGGAEWTRDIAIQYFKSTVAIGLKILTMIFIMGIVIEIIIAQTKVFNNGFSINNAFVTLGTIILLHMLMNKVPDAIANLVSGNWGHMSSLNFASAVATMAMAAQGVKAAAGALGKAGGAAIAAGKNYNAGLNDFTNDYIKKNFPNAAASQNDTFTPNNKNIPGFNNNNEKNGSGFMYQMGKATSWGLSKYAETKSKTSNSNQPGKTDTQQQEQTIKNNAKQ